LLNFGKNNKIKQFQIYKLDNWFFRGSIILNPPKIEEITNPKSENPSWSYTQMCRERLRS
jgi:uncharacterized protein YjdB